MAFSVPSTQHRGNIEQHRGNIEQHRGNIEATSSNIEVGLGGAPPRFDYIMDKADLLIQAPHDDYTRRRADQVPIESPLRNLRLVTSAS